MLDMRRREFITLLCGAATWPMAARILVVGFLHSGSPEMRRILVAAFQFGLRADGGKMAFDLWIGRFP
jgi:hypothetical protein